MVKKVEISHKTIIFTILFLILLWLFGRISDIILQFFVALLLTAILNPGVKKLSSLGMPKMLSIVTLYVAIISVVAIFVSIIVPPLFEQTANLVTNLPRYLEMSGIYNYLSGDVLREFLSELSNIPGQLIRVGFSIFGNILNVLTVLTFSFYLLVSRDKIEEKIISLFGKEKGGKYNLFINTIETKLGSWALGQLSLMILIGVSSYIGFLLLDIPHALPLAVLSGLFEIIPFIGPIVAAIPAILLGFSISPFVGFAVIGLAILIQQVENYLFVPKVMEKSTGVSPVVILLSLAIGFRLAGVVGMIIALPIVIIINTVLEQKFGKI